MNITLIRDNDLTATFTVIRADGVIPDLTSAATSSIDIYVKTSQYDPNTSALAHYSLGSGITLLTPTAAGAVFTCEFTKALTTNYTFPMTLYFDILITDTNGRAFTVGAGNTLTIPLNVSR